MNNAIRAGGTRTSLGKLRRRPDSRLAASVAGPDSHKAQEMIIESLIGLSLVSNVSLDNPAPAASKRTAWLQMSVPQRDAALLPLVHRATDCILRKALADPRYRADMRPNELNELIVGSIAACAGLVRAMIQAHDRMYGRGSGDAFLLGPYLDILPAAVVQRIKAKAR
jgi:hypothetical protein